MTTDSQRFSCRFRLENLEDTAALGARIARALVKGDAVALHGDLGAGKTALARTILLALGAQGPLPSASFTLVQGYETPRLLVHHYDLYRIEDESELDELGLDDALGQGAALIEWPERAGRRLPDEALNLSLTIVNGDVREAVLEGPLRWGSLFLDSAKDC